MTGHQFSYDYGEHVEGAGNYTVVFHADKDATLDEMIQTFRAYLVACGYSHEGVKKAFGGDD